MTVVLPWCVDLVKPCQVKDGCIYTFFRSTALIRFSKSMTKMCCRSEQALRINLGKEPNKKIGPCLMRWVFIIQLSFRPAPACQILCITHFTVTTILWLCINTSVLWVTSSKFRNAGFLPVSHREEATVKERGPNVTQPFLLILPHNQCNLSYYWFCFFWSILILVSKRQK